MSDVWTFERALRTPSFPYNHERAVIYHGTSREAFYDNGRTREEARNPNSILKTGYYSAGNGFSNDFREGLRRSEDFNISKPAVYGGSLKTALLYALRLEHEFNASPVIFEIEVPTEILWTIYLSPRYDKHSEASPENYFYANSLSGIYDTESKNEEKFSSPEDFRHHLARIKKVKFDSWREVRKNDQKMLALKSLMFAVPREIPFSPLEEEEAIRYGHPEDIAGTNWIRGIWDLGIDREQHFLEAREYVEKLVSQIPSYLPSGIESTYVELDYDGYRKFIEFVEDLSEAFAELITSLNSAISAIENDNREKLVESLDIYRSGTADILNLLREVDSNFEWEGRVTVENKTELENYVSGNLENLREMMVFLKKLEREEMQSSVNYRNRLKEVAEDIEGAMNSEVADLSLLEKEEINSA